MKLNVYSIYDTASGTYMRPFFLQSDGQATRAFKDIATDAEHEIGKHPEDYSIHRIGIFDDQKGTLHHEDKECLATGLEMVSQARNVNRDNIEALDMKLKSGQHWAKKISEATEDRDIVDPADHKAGGTA